MSDPAAELAARRSLRRSLSRRASALRASTHRRRTRHGAAVLLGAMTLATGAAVAQSGGAPASATKTRATATGMSGATIKAVQRKIGAAPDGAFGPQTRRLLKRWQRRNGLAADGVPGPATLAAMGIAATAPRASDKISTRAARSASPVLQRIAQCESGGNPAAVSANGRYRGKYQFSRATWRSLGGTGDPAAAPEAEQDRLAAKLFAAQGRAPWPHCGRRA